MTRIMIVEGELLISEELTAIINSIDSNIETTMTSDAKEAISSARNSYYDIFLVDVQLSGYSGFELAKEIRNIYKYKLTPIIFITAIPSKELLAFKEILCYDYIIKPLKEDKVRSVLETTINYVMTKKESYLKLIQKGHSYLVEQGGILYIESRNKKIYVITMEEEIELSSYTLKELLEKLSADFIRCHKGYIINIKHIEKIDKSNNDIYIKHIKKTIPVGRKYKDYLRGRGLWV
ncbi:LytR/AlgR family response regulator transcription factor [Tepidimicrobium xylanilyticum]|uniref:Two component transcriptional regulator, LytTR family n=1 Tax=Tepidimicrobium xylanilyticum TaxID=1123352 RepID=A0A1H3DF26_9FIRM|nr:LytTR family DNA-binding domain-containing protein [Tepidimicrobium xylanilyticum]GMG97368.1 DNA-binding response regulator [Tepidimicrobium xylanilyticum]SDX65063.1 two component transcriptional regulator, LytTR family [Tepidimicrobium xylanilyticum]